MSRETEEQVARTYRLTPDTMAAIDGMAVTYGAPQSQIVNLLLRLGLDELESGRRRLMRRPIRYAVELNSTMSDA